MYEQPLNELTRLNLKLEWLFDRLNTSNDTLSTLKIIIQIIQLLDRPDLNAKYTQALQMELNYCKSFADQPSICSDKLSTLIEEIRTLLHHYSQAHGKIAQSLRHDDFLQSICHRILTPGGGAVSESPSLKAWCHQHEAVITEKLNAWKKELKLLKETVTLLLKLIRSRGKAIELNAYQGFHQAPLESSSQLQLVRINIKDHPHIYPIISAGKHRLSIRFDSVLKDEEFPKNIPFELVCC